jgi:hypothetical protein
VLRHHWFTPAEIRLVKTNGMYRVIRDHMSRLYNLNDVYPLVIEIKFPHGR